MLSLYNRLFITALTVATFLSCADVLAQSSNKKEKKEKTENALVITREDIFKTVEPIKVRTKLNLGLFTVNYGLKTLDANSVFVLKHLVSEDPRLWEIEITSPDDLKLKLKKFYVTEDLLKNEKKIVRTQTMTLDQIKTINTRIIPFLNPATNDACCDAHSIKMQASSDQSKTKRIPSNPIEGAHRIMAALYQDCSVLDLTIEPDSNLSTPSISYRKGVDSRGHAIYGRNLTKAKLAPYIEGQPFLNHINELKKMGKYPKDGCEDMTQKPVVYSYGSRPVVRDGTLFTLEDLSKSQKQTKDYENAHCGTNNVSCSSLPVVGYDCSGFISSAFMAAGLKFQATDTPASEASTNMLDNVAMNAKKNTNNSCMKNVDFATDTIKPGDVISLVHNHTLMINSVGPDPLGIERIISENRSCKSLTVNDLDFTYIHSGVLHGGSSLGTSIVDVKFHAQSGNNITVIKDLIAVAQKACTTVVAANKSSKQPATVYGSLWPTFSILRHVGSEKPACSFSPEERLKIQGDECVKSCI